MFYIRSINSILLCNTKKELGFPMIISPVLNDCILHDLKNSVQFSVAYAH